MTSHEFSLFQIILKGGPMMWPILLCSVFALAVTIERIAFYIQSAEDVEGLREKVFEALKRGDRNAALSLCEAARPPAGRVFRAGLLQSGESRGEIVQAMEREAQVEVPRLEKWLPALSMIANIAPLLGFLGTALGLAVFFFGIQARASAVNQATLGYFSGGIWQALLTTVAGLVVGISAALVYNGCVVWVDRFVQRLEREAGELADLLAYLSETSVHQEGDREFSQEP
jgi:biopolymer transport protein ExbB